VIRWQSVGDRAKHSTGKHGDHVVEGVARMSVYVLRKKSLPASLDDVYRSEGTVAEQVPVDGWGGPIHLVVPGPGQERYDLVSYGEDQIPGSSVAMCRGQYGADIRHSDP
jgi:hypothetical protein